MNTAVSETQYEVAVSVLTFNSLFDASQLPLALDNYQRPFVWGNDKVEQLVNDLYEFIASQTDASPRSVYYMGAILLHEDRIRQRRYIIDGQQRLTSLCVLFHAILGHLPAQQDLHYHSPESVINIRQAQERCREPQAGLLPHDIFDRICFTVISVSSQDLAFTFFDTQNNRGVPLNPTDLLKAYHLRAINGGDRLILQTHCATRWEQLQRTRQVIGRGMDFAPTLFHYFLWRARRWSGKTVTVRESFDAIIEEFQHRTITPTSPSAIPLYPSRCNCLGSALMIDGDGGYHIIPHTVNSNPQAADLPFAIRQPISEGLGFFLYADKYAALVQRLLYEGGTDHHELRAFRTLYHTVIAELSVYLRELFLLACVMYVDQFGFDQLFRFSLWLDHVLGSIRIDKQYIFRETPAKYLREADRNLLDVIAGAYRPDDVILHLRGYAKADAVYALEEIDVGVGVRGRYKQQVLAYYGRRGRLSGKSRWIGEDFIKGKLG